MALTLAEDGAKVDRGTPSLESARKALENIQVSPEVRALIHTLCFELLEVPSQKEGAASGVVRA